MQIIGVFFLKLLAVLMEALPWVAAGCIVSGVLEVLVKDAFLARLLPRSLAGRLVLGLGLSFLLPSCECGIVPVVRRLVRKGFPAPSAITYLVAAPVLNPVVLGASWAGFRGDMLSWAFRAGLHLVLALLWGTVASLTDNRRIWAAGAVGEEGGSAVEKTCGCGHRHDRGREHGHPDGSCCSCNTRPVVHEGVPATLRRIMDHASAELVQVSAWLGLGAICAAAFAVLVPRDILAFLSGHPLLAIPGMMLLAVLLSICSEADAFVAMAFSGMPLAARLAFTGMGPIFDLKLLFMYPALLRPGATAVLAAGSGMVIFGACVVLAVVVPVQGGIPW